MEKTLNQTPKTHEQTFSDAMADESARRARVMDCYRRAGGPLLGWLLDEAKRRGHTGLALALELGVTVSYIHQLRSGHRQLAHISDNFARACSRYLGVPSIVVKLLAGRVSVADFLIPAASEAEVIERGFRSMLDDPSVRPLIPVDVDALSADARRALVMLYAEVTHNDVFGARELPTVLRYLQQAAVVHDENQEMAEAKMHLVA